MIARSRFASSGAGAVSGRPEGAAAVSMSVNCRPERAGASSRARASLPGLADSEGRVTFIIGGQEVGLRLDQALAVRVPGLSRRRARLLIDIGGVFVDGRRVKIAGKLMHAGEK